VHKYLVLVSAFCVTFHTAGCGTTFQPMEQPPPTKELSGMYQLAAFATYQDHPEDLVGRVISIRKVDGKCSSDRQMEAKSLTRTRYVKAGAKPEVKAVTRHLYEARRTISGSSDNVFPFVSAGAQGQYALEYVISQTGVVVGDNLLDETALNTISRLKLPADVCARYVIHSVVVAVVNYRKYTKASSKYQVVGTAFGLSGELYHEQTQFQPSYMILLDLSELSPGMTLTASRIAPVLAPPMRVTAPTTDIPLEDILDVR
jgi:hypothetical protein